MYDIVIIGAGVVGALIARTLKKYNVSVCVLERANDVAMGATKANSAIVHAGYDAKRDTLKAKLNVAGSKMMRTVAEELGVKYRNNGSLVIGFDEEDRRVLEELLARGRYNGVEGLCILEGEALYEIEPKLSRTVKYALYAPSGAIICPYELCIAAMGNAMDNGAELKLNFEVTSIEARGGSYVISSNRETVEAKTVINAAGVYADRIARMIGDDRFTITPRRGEYVLLDKECGALVSHTVFRTPGKMGKGILITPTVDGNLLIGPTSENIEDKEDNSTTAEGLSKVIAQAKENVDGLPFGKTITSFCGLRAVGSTGDFIIDLPKAGFVNVAAIESPGLTASPAIAEYVVALLRESGMELTENKDFHPYRAPAHAFREASAEEKAAIIQRDSSYGRIICRCETVTEGEILAALRQNPKPRDLDGIKRRTRAQMGRCQGGFCVPYLTELLAREWGIPYDAVTKSGGASSVNIGKTKEV